MDAGKPAGGLNQLAQQGTRVRDPKLTAKVVMTRDSSDVDTETNHETPTWPILIQRQKSTSCDPQAVGPEGASRLAAEDRRVHGGFDCVTTGTAGFRHQVVDRRDLTGTPALGGLPSPPRHAPWSNTTSSRTRRVSRNAFIEDLRQRKGMSPSSATSTGPTPEAALAPKGSIRAGEWVAVFVYELSEYVKLIMKVSINLAGEFSRLPARGARP